MTPKEIPPLPADVKIWCPKCHWFSFVNVLQLQIIIIYNQNWDGNIEKKYIFIFKFNCFYVSLLFYCKSFIICFCHIYITTYKKFSKFSFIAQFTDVVYSSYIFWKKATELFKRYCMKKVKSESYTSGKNNINSVLCKIKINFIRIREA